MRSEFVFKLLNRVGPVNRFGGLVAIGDVVVESGCQSRRSDEVVGLQTFALEQTEPDFDLIQPGGIGRQPEHLEAQPSFTHLLLLTEPAFKLFGGVRGSIIKDEGHRLHLTTQRFGNDLLLHKGLKVDKAFAHPTGSIALAITETNPAIPMTATANLRPSYAQPRLIP